MLSPGTVVVILSSFGTTTVGLLSPGTVVVILSSFGIATVGRKQTYCSGTKRR
jgi:hypothetical protein